MAGFLAHVKQSWFEARRKETMATFYLISYGNSEQLHMAIFVVLEKVNAENLRIVLYAIFFLFFFFFFYFFF